MDRFPEGELVIRPLRAEDVEWFFGPSESALAAE